MRRSWPKGIVDQFMLRRGHAVLRCRRCGCRFYRKLQPGEVLGLHELDEPQDFIPEDP